jgi:hypothetical protein
LSNESEVSEEYVLSFDEMNSSKLYIELEEAKLESFYQIAFKALSKDTEVFVSENYTIADYLDDVIELKLTAKGFVEAEKISEVESGIDTLIVNNLIENADGSIIKSLGITKFNGFYDQHLNISPKVEVQSLESLPEVGLSILNQDAVLELTQDVLDWNITIHNSFSEIDINLTIDTSSYIYTLDLENLTTTLIEEATQEEKEEPDTEKPILETSLFSNSQIEEGGTVSIEVVSSDNKALSEVFYQINGGTKQNLEIVDGTVSTTIKELLNTEGSYKFLVTSIDTAGLSATSEHSISVVKPTDTETPKISLYLISGTKIAIDDEVEFKISTSDNRELEKVVYKIGSKSFSPISISGTTDTRKIKETMNSSGAKTVTVTVYDKAGLSSSASVNFEVVAKPVISIGDIKSEYKYNETEIEFSCSSNVNLSSIKWELREKADDSLIDDGDFSPNSKTFSLLLNSEKDFNPRYSNTYYFKVVATDKLGQETSVSTKEFDVVIEPLVEITDVPTTSAVTNIKFKTIYHPTGIDTLSFMVVKGNSLLYTREITYKNNSFSLPSGSSKQKRGVELYSKRGDTTISQSDDIKTGDLLFSTNKVDSLSSKPENEDILDGKIIFVFIVKDELGYESEARVEHFF